MDLICTRCGEPWDLDYVLHDAPGDFKRTGGLITHCPSCPTEEPKHPPAQRERLAAIAMLAGLLGNDIDGLAASLEDFDLLKLKH